MEALSVAASIVGLLAAAAKTNALLETLSSMINAPASVKAARRETYHTLAALKSLKWLLENINLSNPRLEMIQIDELRVVLADAMMVFSSFEQILITLEGLSPVRTVGMRLQWTRYEKKIEDYLGKLERCKSSLNLLLNVLHLNSDQEARLSQAKLQQQVEQVLADNATLKQKLQQSQDSFDARSIATGYPDEEDDGRTIRGPGVRRTDTVRSNATMQNVRNSIIRFAFENILERSRPYLQTSQLNECDRSFTSDAVRSDAWSVFTGYSLSKISVLSVIAMPICAADLANGGYYRNVPSSESSNIQAPIAEVEAEDSETETESDDEEGTPINTLSIDTARDTNDPGNTFESPRCLTKTTPSPADTDEKKPTKIWAKRSTWYEVKEFEVDEEEPEFFCQGCRKTTDETKGLITFSELHSKWHLACWTCHICKSPLQPDGSDVLEFSTTLTDGKLTCIRCGHSCGVCGTTIQGEQSVGILVAGKVHCVWCFSCTACGDRIRSFFYGRREDKIFCISCEDRLWIKEKEDYRRTSGISAWSTDEENPYRKYDSS
ncbi:hypothetical protein QBC38DRAFT_402897 [Podospora fimiseda]|uniref:LIM zinc-binding domain-containing protein n=1 Tax=Podospora fimiseda TaxID=252190 RepID=A0AAN7BGK1_9PEZI|nr:hypothetical protein QBC38DRAFT_402897 [Podospora fimiseda]